MNKYKTIFEGVPIGLSIISREMEILELNTKMREWFPGINVEKKPICFKTFNVPPRHKICDHCPIVKTFEDGKVYTTITETSSSDKIVNYRVTSLPVFDEEGRVAAVLEIVDDVTERKQVEEALRGSEEKYSGIFDESIVAVYIFDEKKNFIDSNQAGLDMLGYSRAELLNMGIPDVDANLTVVLPAHEQLLSGERIINYEHKLKKKDGTVITVLNNSKPLTDVDGNVIGIQSTLIDITERKKAEEELKESEEKYRTLFKSVNELITIADINAKTIWANPAWTEVFGSPSKYKDNPFELLHPDDMEKTEKAWKNLISDDREIRNLLYRYKLQSGEYHIFETSAKKIKLRGKTYAYIIANDITERQQADATLKKAYKDLKIIDKLKSEFLQNVTHELRTPITAMLASLRLLKDSVKDEKLHQILELNEDSTWRLNRIVGDLLEVSQIERGTKELKLEPVDMNDLISNALADIKVYADESNLKVEFKREKGLPKVAVDRDSMYRVISNLLNNAVKFNREGGLVEVKTSADDGFIEVSISDTGIGIDEKDQKKVFDIFYQIDGSTARKYGGTGIGLSLVKELVEMHNGKIWVESEPGEWTRFSFTLPAGG